MSLQEDLKAFEMENKDMVDKWKKDINSWEVLKNKFQLVQRELNTLQQRPGSSDSESQQNWETDSAFQSGTSSPTFSVSSQLESPAGKQILVEDRQTKNQELQVSFDNLSSKFDELQSKLSLSDDKWKLSLKEQADLLDKLCIKESEISSLIDKLDAEKDKSHGLEREISKVNKNLCNTQKLLRQYHTKKVNWTC